MALGEQTRWQDGHLQVSEATATGLLAHRCLATARVRVALPGESVRLVHVLDSVEPRSKAAGAAGVFPGIAGPLVRGGDGDTHVLRGAAVVVAGRLPRAQDALIDMSGPAAELSPLGATCNLVVEFEAQPGAPWDEVDAALRVGMLRLAEALAAAAAGVQPDAVEEIAPLAERRGGRGDRPRVGAITNLQTQGAFKDVLVYGRSFGAALPALVEPAELEDGAVVSAQFGHPALKNPTYIFQNHPVVAALRERDGVDLDLAALILSPEPVELARKELVSEHAARLCQSLGLDAVIVTKEGGGNADADVALKIDALESLGITGVGLFAEMAGADGSGPPLVVAPQRGGAVSTGNYDTVLALPRVDVALGGDRFEPADADATGPLEVPAAVVYGALSPLGWGRLTASEGAA